MDIKYIDIPKHTFLKPESEGDMMADLLQNLFPRANRENIIPQ